MNRRLLIMYDLVTSSKIVWMRTQMKEMIKKELIMKMMKWQMLIIMET